MLTYGFIKSRKEMEAEMVNIDEELASQMAQSSTGFHNVNIMAEKFSKRNLMISEVVGVPTKGSEAINGAYNSAIWGGRSTDENIGGGGAGGVQRSSLRSLNNSLVINK
jgi:hypothetical protein